MSKGCYVASRTLLRVCLSAEQMQVQVQGGGGGGVKLFCKMDLFGLGICSIAFAWPWKGSSHEQRVLRCVPHAAESLPKC